MSRTYSTNSPYATMNWRITKAYAKRSGSKSSTIFRVTIIRKNRVGNTRKDVSWMSEDALARYGAFRKVGQRYVFAQA